MHPSNNKINIIIKTAAHIGSEFIHHFGVNEETCSVEGEAIKEYIIPNKELITKHTNGLFTSSMTMVNVRYYFSMNRNGEFEGEMLSKDVTNTGY